MTSYDAVVLAGGAARRLGGADKPGVRVGGRSLLDRVLAACADADTTVVVAERRPTARPVLWAREEPPGGGPLAALGAGLSRTTADTVLVLSADLPFLGEGTVRLLLDALATGRPEGTEPDSTQPEAGPSNATQPDSSRSDSPQPDSSRSDSSRSDSPRPDSPRPHGPQPNDAQPNDAQPNDAGPNDAQPNDAGPNDAQPNEAGPNEAGPNDAEPNDAEPDGPQPERQPPEGALLVDAEGRDQPLVAAYRAEALRRGLERLTEEHGGLGGLPLRRLTAGLTLTRVTEPGDSRAAFDCDTWEDIAEARARIREHEHVLDEWITAVKDELGIDLEVDTGLLLDLARDAAHGVARPAAPLTTFLVGYAAARAEGGPEAVAEAARKAAALAARWADEDKRDDQPGGAPGADTAPDAE
ncbi:DUF6457 domain-containing protein [Streptomyces luteolus]|uniref:DUF6457 domain-containing protein n=1 Tax=Streptomyces luteolus TaxID=3043615 RepID=A0ABT6SZE2_9ACTN|nr:DUF6457 domain-containing protein [Streptomyces sp. B-S-A12]MDI3420977.1 DUF6457 domain-containing protein [Streptomyces sp. B-S-A12]